MPDPQRRAVSLLLEGVVVLVSILAAFFLEGWRADRELARELTQELASVRVELQRNRELVDAELQSLHRVETAGLALEGLLASVEARQVTVPDTLALLAIQWTPSFSPSLGAVTALISSGRLAQVEATPLRLGLAGRGLRLVGPRSRVRRALADGARGDGRGRMGAAEPEVHRVRPSR